MANNNINVLQTLIQLRRGTEEQWNLVKDTFIPREGEPCVTIQEDGYDALIKIGDGKRTWGQLGYTRDSFFVFFDKTETETEEGTLVTTDTTLEELVLAVESNKILMAYLGGEGPSDFDFLLPLTAFGPGFVFSSNGITIKSSKINSEEDNVQWYLTVNNLMETSAKHSDNFDAQNKSIVNLKDSENLTSAVTKQYTDNSTPTFIYLEEQNGAIKSKVTDLNTLKTALMSQTNGYTQTSNPLYKAIKCYAMLNGNCYDLVYSSLEDTQEAGKVAIVKRTFYAVTTDGLNKLNVVIDENQTDENQKVVWTKEAQGVASEQFVVTVQDVDGVDKSDKTPAEIKAAAETGKQVILKRIYDLGEYAEADIGFLVNIVDDIASFCFTLKIIEGTADIDPVFSREWVYIFSDKTVKSSISFNVPVFVIEEDDNGKYTSQITPYVPMTAARYGSAANIMLMKDSENFFGTISLNTKQAIHFYFPDYARNKVYDLKWNEDQNPFTYTFTELSLGGGTASGEPLTVHITEDSSTKKLVADKTYEEIVAAINSGRNVRCQSDLWEYYSSYYTYRDANRQVTFVIETPIGENDKELFQVAIMTYAITTTNEVVYSSGNLSIPYGLLHTAGKNQILKTDENGAMKYVDANRYLVKQATSSESGLFLSTDGYGGQKWANPLTAGNSDSVVIKSSTPNSTKKFRITVDDAGTISATEVIS